MPEKIETATIKSIETDVLEIDDNFPGTYGFYVRLSRDPGAEWAAEFESVYDEAPAAGKPPIQFRGDTLCVFYLPRYGGDLPKYLRFLNGIIAKTNKAVEQRNSVLPDEEQEKETFRAKLREAAQDFAAKTSP